MPDQQQWTFLNYYVDEMLGIFLDTCLVGDTTCFPSVFEHAMLKSRWRLQPNPAADFTRLVRTDSPLRISQITLMESTGRVHRRWQPAGVIREQELDLRGLTPGLYFVLIRDEQGTEVLKLVKH